MMQDNKALVLNYQKDLEATKGLPSDLNKVFKDYCHPQYLWHGVYPFESKTGAEAVIEGFYQPLFQSFDYLQRRQDIFMAGESVSFGGNWVMSMGQFMGMYERDFLGIPSHGKIAFLRYCEFHRIEGGIVAETYCFVDLIGLMNQVGANPLPMQTGAEFIIPGPRTHDGQLFKPQDVAESLKTLKLIEQMASDLGTYRDIDMNPKKLAETWHENMIWYGPSGIGSSMSISGFKRQHQIPFRKSLYSQRKHNGHKSRFAEGHYAAWVGWPSLSLVVSAGGYLGLPKTDAAIDMRVIDVYRREGDKLAENWVFIDTPYTLKQQDLDIFERMRQILRR
ncbi:MAG: ester cyclase [Deinococcales bacterium]